MDAALELVRFGFTVFPLAAKSKEPEKGKSWKLLQTKSPAEVLKLFPPNSNVAVVMGREAGMVGLDIDYDDGADPELLKRLPLSWTAKTGKGHHVYYKYPSHWPEIGKGTLLSARGASGKPKACVQLRANGHYFVGVGSVHPETGARYAWAKYEGWADGVKCDLLSPEEIPLADAPDFLLDAINADKAREKEPGAKYFESERHGMFVATATAMRRNGHDEETILGRLRERNQEDCTPPKDNAEVELSNIAKWACLSVQVLPVELRPVAAPALTPEQHTERLGLIRPLGHLDNDYFYLSQSNQQITKLGYASHSSSGLLNLMPWEFWYECYGNKKGVDWTKAGGDLMQACRRVGIFNPRRMRGAGAWTEDSGLVLHLGGELVVGGSRHPLVDYPSRNTYRLGPEVPAPRASAATVAECGKLLAACAAPHWQRRESAILFAGAVSLQRLCGALPWRPHLWLTGAAGSGKTTLMNTVVRHMVGEWGAYFQGVTTEAGIRQKLGCDSLPVVFDEAESDNKRGAGRIQHILELARQASSDSDARIVKGTPDGRGLSFKINSTFLLSSIRVNLPQEADQTRFAVLELGRPDVSKSLEFNAALQQVTPELGEAIFTRMVQRFHQLLSNYRSLSHMVGIKSSPRHGQQYGMLLAAYGCLVSDLALDVVECGELIEKAGVCQGYSEAEANAPSDEMECLMALVDKRIRMQVEEDEPVVDITIRQAIDLAAGSKTVVDGMQAFGLNVVGNRLIVANSNVELAHLFANTKWADSWWRSLQRLPGAERVRARLQKSVQQRATAVPIDLILSNAPCDGDEFPF